MHKALHGGLRLFVAAAVSAGFCLVGPTRPALADEPVQGAARNITADDSEEIRDLLEELVDEVMVQNEYDSFVDLLVESDQERIDTDLADKDLEALNARIAQIRRAWKQKYGREFDIGNEDVVFQNCTIAQTVADEGDPQDTLRATVTCPKMAGLPAQRLSVANQKVLTVDRWRVDIDNRIGARQFYNNVAAALTRVGQNTDAWPDDVNQGYRWVAAHVFAALSNEKFPQVGDPSQGQPARQPPAAAASGTQRRGGQAGAQDPDINGLLLIEERVVYLLVNEPQRHLLAALQFLTQNQPENAAAEVRLAASYLDLQAGREGGQGRKALQPAARELRQLAQQIEQGQAGAGQIRSTFASANRALARHHVAAARRAISNDKSIAAGHDLQAAAQSLEQAVAWSRQKPQQDVAAAIVNARLAAAQLMDGSQGDAQLASSRQDADGRQQGDSPQTASQAAEKLARVIDNLSQQDQQDRQDQRDQQNQQGTEGQQRPQDGSRGQSDGSNAARSERRQQPVE